MPKILDIEGTPNPNAIKFLLKERLSWGVPRSFYSPAQASDDPLAAALFAIEHVTNVYYVDNWISVTQDGKADWYELQRLLAVPIRAAPEAPEPVRLPPGESAVQVAPEDEARFNIFNDLLDQQIRPALERDGGGIEILALEGPRLTVRYHGACGSCPSSLSGTLTAIEGLLRRVEPNIELIAA